MEPDAIWTTFGGVGGLVVSLVGLLTALRTGVLANGKELTRLQAAVDKQLADQEKSHAAELARLEALFGGTITHERQNAANWRANTEKLQGALDVALDANGVWARQAELSAVTSDLTNRVLETIRQHAIGAGG
jgi:hypothetical protein